jgi:hypothetical protein
MPNHAYTIIDHLSPDDALAILKILACEDDRLGARIAEVASSYLCSVDPEEIALDNQHAHCFARPVRNG